MELFRINFNSILKFLKTNNNIEDAVWLINIIIERKLNKKTLEMLYLKYQKSYFIFKEIDESLLEICKNMSNDEASKPNKSDSNKTYRE